MQVSRGIRQQRCKKLKTKRRSRELLIRKPPPLHGPRGLREEESADFDFGTTRSGVSPQSRKIAPGAATVRGTLPSARGLAYDGRHVPSSHGTARFAGKASRCR